MIMQSKNNKLSEYFSILECSEDATWVEIKKSYKILVELYSSPSMATEATEAIEAMEPQGSWPEDSGENERYGEINKKNMQILEELHEAYGKLEEVFHKKIVREDCDVEQVTSQVITFSGASLKRVREALGIDLLDIAIASNVQMSHLQNIEEEVFEELPTEIYLKGYLASYADYLSLDTKRVLDDYLLLLHDWREQETGKRDKAAYNMKNLIPSWFDSKLK